MTAPDPQAAHDLASRVYATHRGYSFVEAIRQYLDAAGHALARALKGERNDG
jgi:hypothetical protein